MDRMEVKRDIYQLWLHYKAKNEEEYFRLFVRGFVSVWEGQLPLDWSSLPNWTDIRPDSGPHLSRLPEELLPTVSQFMQEARSDTENRTLNCESLSEVELLTHLLTILARNLDNIPLIASCDYVSISIGIAATVIHQLVEESAHFGEAGVSFFTSVCHLLEVLYDPYFTWHHFLRGNEADFEKIAFQPALLHVEVVPFIYDCFETNLIESYPHLGSQLIHVLGAVVSGAQSIIVQLDPVFPALPSLAQSTLVKSDKAKKSPVLAKGLSKTSSCFCLSDGHNALRAICPATVNMIIAVVGNLATPPELRYHALQCFVLMARVLLKSSPDQRQIEVGTMVQLIRDLLIREVKEGSWTSDSIHALTQIVSAVKALLVWPLPPKKSQAHNISYSHAQALHAHMQQLLLDCQIPDALILLLNESASKNMEKQSLAVEVVRVFSALLAGSNSVKERLLKTDVYTRIADALRSLGDPKRPLLRALLALATEENECHSSESENVLKNGHALLVLLRWLPAVPDVDQVWLAENIAKLCNASLQSRVVCSAHQVILEICALMEQHASLSRPTVGELLGLLEGLAAHCITPLELKSIFLLLREGDSEEKCPYQSQLLHAISAVARRGEHSDCHYFFNIQNDTDGLSVPGIRKWPGAGYGFSFHCWVKLDSEPDSAAPSPTSPASRATSPGSAASPASGRSGLSPMTVKTPIGSHPSSPASSQTSSSRVGVENKRRQLFNLLTSNNTGVEIFFRADGMLVVAISTKKEFLTATVPDIPLTDNRWHCIGVCITMARRPFGHNQIQVFVDGTQRLSVSIKFPSMSEPFTYCTIGSAVQRGAAAPGVPWGDGPGASPRRSPGVLERAAGAGGGLLPSLMNQVPSYLSLPLPLRGSAPLDPNVKSFQAGLQDAVWGSAGCLRGQLGTAALLQDALGPMQARLLFQQGPNWRGLFSSEEGADLSDLVNRLVFCFSPAACWDNLCLDLAPGNKYDGHVLATQCSTLGIKLTSVLLRTDRVYDMHKKRLRLQDSSTVLAGLVGGGVGMYPGLIALLGDQKLSMEVAAMLLDQVLLTETAASYAGALSLLHALSLAELDIKVEVARKVLTTLFMRPGAPGAVARQVGWQDCVSRLLVKRPISTAPTSAAEDSSLPDLMTFDEDAFELDGGATASSLIHRSHSPSSVSRISASVSDAASVLESEIKDVAESVTLAIGDNIQYAADNISSFMGSAYSVFRQKTVEMQESLEGLGESAVHRLKHNGAGAVRSGSSLSERPSVDSASPGTRSRSSSSSEDVSSAAAESSRASLSVTDGAAQSQDGGGGGGGRVVGGRGEQQGLASQDGGGGGGGAGGDSDTEEQREALRQWVALDADRQGDREEDLCYLVLNILFTVLWRGVETGSRDCWRGKLATHTAEL
ncbi:hypothetical protein FOCC_FOCC002185 [Frankliniella occidentalis]|nr:hypothetical protein FOCC_FOCC002185 [Frankliniella occidentalis]